MKRIVVDPPVSEARRERVERQLFQQLAAVRVADRAEAVIPPPKKSRAAMWWGAAACAAAVVATVLFITRDGATGGQLAQPSRVVTPVDSESTFTIGHEAVVVAKRDTSVEWHQGRDGSITLQLARGAVDCQVEPRHGRPPFKVVSGDITVVVVGTRFTVTRTPSPRVDVAHGKVRVEAPGGTWFVEAGESWTPISVTAIEEPDQASDPGLQASGPAPEIEMDPIKVSRAKKAAAPPAPESDSGRSLKREARSPSSPIAPPETRELAKEAYRAAQHLENTDPKLAAANYRAIALGKDDGWAATALVALAELDLKQNEPQAALDALDEHARRFPRSAMREDAAWFRIEALRSMGKRDEARGAAADYLREFPDGVYVKPAARLVK
ncbi:MAG TPA: FecR domain-containing protein [Kofleriaceae bacterium]|nr:FecR domain-containing protein [Kofleriaceae bacterium]